MALQQHFNDALTAPNFNGTKKKTFLGLADMDNFSMVFLNFIKIWNKDGGSNNVDCRWGWLHFKSFLKVSF